MTHAELLHRFQNHPIGVSLRQLSAAADDDTRETCYIMVITIAELLCWQGELNTAERDCFHAEATRQVNSN